MHNLVIPLCNQSAVHICTLANIFKIINVNSTFSRVWGLEKYVEIKPKKALIKGEYIFVCFVFFPEAITKMLCNRKHYYSLFMF